MRIGRREAYAVCAARASSEGSEDGGSVPRVGEFSTGAGYFRGRPRLPFGAAIRSRLAITSSSRARSARSSASILETSMVNLYFLDSLNLRVPSGPNQSVRRAGQLASACREIDDAGF